MQLIIIEKYIWQITIKRLQFGFITIIMKYINTFKYVYIIIIFQFLSFSRKINIFLIIFIKHNKISLHLNQVLLLDLVFPKHFIFNLINLIIDYKQ